MKITKYIIPVLAIIILSSCGSDDDLGLLESNDPDGTKPGLQIASGEDFTSWVKTEENKTEEETAKTSVETSSGKITQEETIVEEENEEEEVEEKKSIEQLRRERLAEARERAIAAAKAREEEKSKKIQEVSNNNWSESEEAQKSNGISDTPKEEQSESNIKNVSHEVIRQTLASGVFTKVQVDTSGMVKFTKSWSKSKIEIYQLETGTAPDLWIYLSKKSNMKSNNDIKSAVKIADLKSKTWNQTYEIPSNIDLSQYKSIAIHCTQYNKLFGSASMK